MTRNHIFKTCQNTELREKRGVVINNVPQVSQDRGFRDIKKLNNTNNQISKNIDPEKLKLFLGEDWNDYKVNPKELEFQSDLLFIKKLMKKDKVPDNFAAITLCKLCDYVYVPTELTNSGSVLGCLWC